MITIDRFSYHSGLRYVNTGEKFAFSVITLVLCVGSRSVCLAVFVLLAMGILTIKKGKIPLGGYLRLLSVPVAFLGMNSLVLGTSIRQTPLEVFSVRFGTWYLTAGRETICYGIQIFVTAMAAVSCLYFLSCNTTMTDIFCFASQVEMSGFDCGADAFNLPVYFCIIGSGTGCGGCPEVQAGKPGLPDWDSFLWTVDILSFYKLC